MTEIKQEKWNRLVFTKLGDGSGVYFLVWPKCFLCSVPPVKKGDVLCSPFSQYTVQEILGCGVYGQVAKCQDMSTNNMVAVKILPRAQGTTEAEKEVHCCSTLLSSCDQLGGVLTCCNAFFLSVGKNVK